MTKSPCWFTDDGPSMKRLITLAFFRWRLQRNDRGTVTFTIKGGDKIRVTVLHVVVGGHERLEGWVELVLLDEKATLGAKRLRCLYNPSTRHGVIGFEYATALQELVQTMH